MRCLPEDSYKICDYEEEGFTWISNSTKRVTVFNDQPSFRTSIRICWSATESPSWKRNHGKPCIIDFDIKDDLSQITNIYFNEDGEGEPGVKIHDIKDINKVHPDYQELCRDFLKENRP